MALTVDPQQREVRALARAFRWRGRRVLEVGCGDGRLTQRLAGLRPGAIQALDPDAASVRRARATFPRRHRNRVRFRVGSALDLPWRAHEFDCVVFARAL
jgi:ubiquinone/menaquinone biosynthesis C-methylase UbiE